jgi:DNA-binding MarR family transcriptional regulator
VLALDRAADGILREHVGISYKRFYFLIALSHFEEVTQHELAVALGYSDPAVSTMAADLVREGLVTVKQSPDHGRKRLVQLSTRGRQIATVGGDVLEVHFDELLTRAGVDGEAYAGMTGALFVALAEKMKEE